MSTIEQRNAFPFADLPELGPRYNVSPTQQVAAIRRDADLPKPEFAWLRWGFLAPWAEAPKDRPQPTNAKSETVACESLDYDAQGRQVRSLHIEKRRGRFLPLKHGTRGLPGGLSPPGLQHDTSHEGADPAMGGGKSTAKGTLADAMIRAGGGSAARGIEEYESSAPEWSSRVAGRIKPG